MGSIYGSDAIVYIAEEDIKCGHLAVVDNKTRRLRKADDIAFNFVIQERDAGKKAYEQYLTVTTESPKFKKGDTVRLIDCYTKDPIYKRFNRKERKIMSQFANTDLEIEFGYDGFWGVKHIPFMLPESFLIHADKKFKTVVSISGIDQNGKHVTEEIPCTGVSKNVFKTVGRPAPQVAFNPLHTVCPNCLKSFHRDEEPYCTHCGYPSHHKMNGEITNWWRDECREQPVGRYDDCTGWDTLYCGGRQNGKSLQAFAAELNRIATNFMAVIKKDLTEEEFETLKRQLEQKYSDLMVGRGTYKSVIVASFDKQITELKKRIIPEKRKWTEAEMREAKDIVYGLMIDRSFSAIQVDSTHSEKSKVITAHYIQRQYDNSWSIIEGASAKCSDGDEYNEAIGIMVAVCKLCKEKLPSWIKGGA